MEPVLRRHCWGNKKRWTVMGEVLTDGFSDRGSTPLISMECYRRRFPMTYGKKGYNADEGIAAVFLTV